LAQAILSVLAVAVLSLGVAVRSHALDNRPPFSPIDVNAAGFLQPPAAAPTATGATPAATGVTPVVSTVVPRSDVVTPEGAMAERTVSSSSAGEADGGGSSNPFSGVRGGFIGAGIGVGAFLLVAALVAAARAGLRRVRP